MGTRADRLRAERARQVAAERRAVDHRSRQITPQATFEPGADVGRQSTAGLQATPQLIAQRSPASGMLDSVLLWIIVHFARLRCRPQLRLQDPSPMVGPPTGSSRNLRLIVLISS